MNRLLKRAWRGGVRGVLFMRRPINIAIGLLSALVVCPGALAEVFVLRAGGRIEGEHLNPQRVAGQPYQLRTSDGLRLSLADQAIARVIVKTDVDKQYEALLAKAANTEKDQWALAEWCKEAGLLEARRRHLQAVIAVNPDHAEARKALGYQRFPTKPGWLTQDEYMQSLGYVRYKGAWRTKQEVEIEADEAQYELKVKQLRKDIRRWFEQLASGGRHADAADRDLAAINDPDAAPALAEILSDASNPRVVRERCLAILSKLPPGLATGALINLALNDSDGNIQDECLDELKRGGTGSVLPVFINQLKSKENSRVNRAGDCLQRLGDPAATLALINALVTTHTEQVSPGTGPGGISTSFSPTGGGTFGMGSKAQYSKRKRENPSVRNALTSLHPGVNYQFDVEAWRSWYIQSKTTSKVNLRRDD